MQGAELYRNFVLPPVVTRVQVLRSVDILHFN